MLTNICSVDNLSEMNWKYPCDQGFRHKPHGSTRLLRLHLCDTFDYDGEGVGPSSGWEDEKLSKFLLTLTVDMIESSHAF
jgi:hypothetical protein